MKVTLPIHRVAVGGSVASLRGWSRKLALAKQQREHSFDAVVSAAAAASTAAVFGCPVQAAEIVDGALVLELEPDEREP